MNIVRFFNYGLFGLLLAGCAPMEPFHLPKLSLPATWHTPHTYEAEASQPHCPIDFWWETFGSATLNELEQIALQHNHDLKAAMARLSQADAQLRMARSPLLPSLDLSAGDQIAKQRSTNLSSSSNPRNSTIRTSQAALSTSYEIDFWGKNHSTIHAAEASRQASRFDQEVIALTVTSELASDYFNLLTLDARRTIALQTRDLAHQIQQLIDHQAEFGQISAQEVLQQQNATALIEGQIAALEKELIQALHGLTLFTGRPTEELSLPLDELPTLNLPTIQPGLPAELLHRRPDLQRAEANLKAANADIGIARAALFPAIQLTGEYGYSSTALSTLLSPASQLWNLGGNLVASLFDHGKTQGAIDLAKAKQTASVQEYQQAVIAALRDVEDALTAVHWLEKQERAYQTAETAETASVHLAKERFQAGAVDYLTVLKAQRTLLKAKDDLLQTRQARLNAAIGLFKALGGGMRDNPDLLD